MLSKTDPRKFWKYIHKYNSKTSTKNDIGVDDFVEHFKNMSSNPHPSSFNSEETDNLDNNVNVDELDCAFTVDEIVKTISNMKRFKSCDLSNNVADFYIDCKEFISPYLMKIFNFIFDNEVYPAD